MSIHGWRNSLGAVATAGRDITSGRLGRHHVGVVLLVAAVGVGAPALVLKIS